MKWRLFLVIWAGIVASAASQDFNFINYSFNQGLRHTQISDISQDANGNLWLTPVIGNYLYRFDGRDFKRFTISVPGVNKVITPFFIRCAPDQTIWMLTDAGVVKFDGVQFAQVLTEKELQVSGKVRLQADGHSNMWILDGAGGVFFQASGSTAHPVRKNYPIDGREKGFLEWKGETLIFSTASELLSASSGNQVSLSVLNEKPNFVTLLKRNEELLIVYRDEIRVWNTATEKMRTIPLGTTDITTITQLISYKGALLALVNGSVMRLDELGAHPIHDDPDFDYGSVFRMFVDRSNSIWLATNSKGIYHLAARKLRQIPLPGSDLSSTIYALDKGRVLSGTYKNGIVEVSDGQISKSAFHSLEKDGIESIVAGPGGYLVAGTINRGAFALTPDGGAIPLKTTDSPLANNILPVVTYENTIWFSSFYGLHSFSSALKNTVNLRFQELGIGSYLHFIFPYDSVLLLGTAKDGLFSFDLQTHQSFRVRSVGDQDILYSMKKDHRGQFWISGESPFLRILDRKLNVVGKIDLSRYCANIQTFEFLNPNRLLVGSNDGIFLVVLQGDYKINTVKKLSRSDGYNGGEVFLGSMVRAGDKIWFGTTEGVCQYRIDSSLDTTSAPNSYITNVSLTKEQKDWNAGAVPVKGLYPLPCDLTLRHNENSLTFSFYANDFLDNEDLTFRYQLDGFNTWSDYSKVENVTYSNLRPGTYTFRVQAKDALATGTVASFSFTILPAFWQTAWFYVLAAVLTVLLIYGYIRYLTRYRIRQYKLEENIRSTEATKLRKQIAMDFHDEMGNKLASILVYSGLLKSQAVSAEHKSMFDYFQKSASFIYDGTKDFIWSIDVETNNLREVIIYLRDFGVLLFEKHDIEFHVENDILSYNFNKPLREGYNRQIVLLFKEAMTNILKHANSSKVRFDACVSGRRCQIIIEDNGTGIQKVSDGKGMKSMEMRAKRIAAGLTITSKSPAGTKVMIEFDI